MYSKAEVKALRKEFWTIFGTLMKPHLSAEGYKINWVNYKTGVSDVRFKMDATKKEVSIGIYLLHKDDGIRELFYEQFLELRSFLHGILEEEWHWDKLSYDHYGAAYASISLSAPGNIFDKDQWPDMFAFLKPRLLRLDEFWTDAYDTFEALA